MRLNRIRNMRVLASVVALGVLAGCVTSGQAPSPSVSDATLPQRVADPSLLAAGESRMVRGDMAGAAALFRSAHDTAPEDPVPLRRLGDALNRMGSYSDATLVYGKAVKLAPKDPDGQRGMGNALVGLAQPGLAIPYFLEAIQYAPDDWRAYLGLGVAHDLAGDPQSAQQSYEAGLALVPNNPDLINNFALSLALAGANTQSIAMLTTLTEQNFGIPRFRGSLAIVYALAGDEPAAGALMSETETPEAIQRNLTTLRGLRGLADHAKKARAIQALITG